MPKPWELPLLVALSGLTALVLIYFAGRLARRWYVGAKLGKGWVSYRSHGREAWMLVDDDGEMLDRIRRTSGGRWATQWGREFDSLIEAARWIEEKNR